jgi:hypothetical protein
MPSLLPHRPRLRAGVRSFPPRPRPSRLRRAAWLPLAAASCAAAIAAALLTACDPASAPGPSQRAFTPAFSATGAQVMEFLGKAQGGSKAKLAFIDKTGPEELLCYVDFSEAAPAIHVIKAARGAEVPVISPDGKWIAYASGTGTEAGSPPGSHSSAWLVRIAEDAQPVLIAADSACEPRFVQNDPGKLAVVYTTQSPDFGWEGHGRTMKAEIDVSGAAPAVGTPTVLCATGSYSGGLSYDNRYLCGGGGHVAMLDLKGSKDRPDTLSYGMIQSCNASISTSRVRTDALMYLDTKGQAAGIDGGKPWGEWQTILIGDASKRLLKGYTYPATFAHPLETSPASVSNVKWHHCEWSNHPHFAAATVNVERYFKAASGYANTALQERIYLIDLKDSSYLEVLRPDTVKYTGKAFDVSGFYWPWLWVEVPDGFQEAPAWLDKAL